MKRLVGDCCGQATVEAAFALPLALLCVLLLLQPGIILYDRMVMQAAAAEGCRLLATSPAGSEQSNEDYIRRRLGAVPQQDLFHIHGGSCSWDIELTGNETTPQVSVAISNKVRLLPLIGAAMAALGASSADGTLDVRVSVVQSTQPRWAAQSALGLNPAGWVGSWVVEQ